jgi:hypothetical protein
VAANGGTNANGVEVVSVVLSIEPNSFDSSVLSFAVNTGFEYAGIDCVLDGDTRAEVREGFSYYSGLSSSRVPSSSALRRAFVLINGVQNSPSHALWEVLYNDDSYSRARQASVLASIDSIMPGTDNGVGGGIGMSFTAWAAANDLSEAESPLMDSDGDGLSNAMEFYFGAEPNAPNVLPLSVSQEEGKAAVLHFPTGKDRVGLTAVVEGSSDLTQWIPIELVEDAWFIEPGEMIDQATVTLPLEAPPFARLSVTLEE